MSVNSTTVEVSLESLAVPKLQIVYNSGADDSYAGIYTFQAYMKDGGGKDEWSDRHRKETADPEKNLPGRLNEMHGVEMATAAPNLSLDIGIKRDFLPHLWFIAAMGLILQGGVLAFAVVVT